METEIQIEPDLVKNLMQCNPCYWAIKNKIRLMGGTVFTLNGCEYLEDIMLDSARSTFNHSELLVTLTENSVHTNIRDSRCA